MRKKNIHCEKINGYALQVINQNGENETVITSFYSQRVMEVFKELALTALENHVDETYSVIVYKDENNLSKCEIYGKEIFRLNISEILEDEEYAISYIECLGLFFRDRRLLEKIENVISEFYLKYEMKFDYLDALHEKELKNLYGSVKNRNWKQYKKICDSLEYKAEELYVNAKKKEHKKINYYLEKNLFSPSFGV